MKGKAEKDALLMLSVSDAEFPLFNDGKPLRVDVAKGSLSGSEGGRRVKFRRLPLSGISASEEFFHCFRQRAAEEKRELEIQGKRAS